MDSYIEQTSVDQRPKIYIHLLCTDTGHRLEDLLSSMANCTSKESILSTRLDDDDDDDDDDEDGYLSLFLARSAGKKTF